jgi:hypothetical protein
MSVSWCRYARDLTPLATGRDYGIGALGVRGMGAVLVAASAADVVWSIGVFVGTPAALFVALVVKHYAKLRRQRSRDRQEAESMLEEGHPPGPPVGDDDDP